MKRKIETKYVRKGAIIRNIDGTPYKDYTSINKAKKASRVLQGATQGQGLVRVAK